MQKMQTTVKLWFGLFLLLFGLSATMQAQVVFSHTIPPGTSPFSVCGNSQFISVGMVAQDSMTNNKLTITLVTGMNYVPGSAYYVDSVGVPIGPATEFNIGNLSAPVLTMPDLGAGWEFELRYEVKADCRMIGSANPASDYTFDYHTELGVARSSSDTSPGYNIAYAALTITSVTNQNYVGSTDAIYTRTVTIRNNGFGALPLLTLRSLNVGINVLSLTGATAPGLPRQDANITISDFTGVGDGDALLENGESVTISEQVQLLDCRNMTSAWTASYGCYGAGICPTVSGIDIRGLATGGASINPANRPNITSNVTVTNRQVCLGTTSPTTYTMTLTNSGTEDATDVAYYITVEDAWGGQFLSNLQLPTGVTLASSQTSPAACAGAATNGAYHRVNLTIASIPAGQTKTIVFDQLDCPSFCGGSEMWLTGGRFSTISYKFCGNTYTTGGSEYDRTSALRGMSGQYASAPETIRDGETKSFCYAVGGNSGLSLPMMDNAGYFEIKTTLPANLVYNPGNAAAFTKTGITYPIAAGYPQMQSGGVLVVRYNYADKPAGFNINPQSGYSGGGDIFCVDLTATAFATCGYNYVNTKFETYIHPCNNGDFIKLSCSDIIATTLQVSTAACINCEGINQTAVKVTRTSVGYPDLDNNYIPDNFNRATPTADGLRQFLVGDTMRVDYTSYINNPGGSRTFKYGEVKFSLGSARTNSADVAHLSTTARIYDASTSTYHTVSGLVPTASIYADDRVFTYDISSANLIALNPALTGFSYEDGDSLFMTPMLQISQDASCCENTRLIVPTAYLSEMPNPSDPADVYGCGVVLDKWAHYALYVNKTVWVSPAAGCGLGRVRTELILDTYAGSPYTFPNEARVIGTPREITVALPPGTVFDNAVVTSLINGSSTGQYEQSITPDIITAGSVTFSNINNKFTEYGGTLLQSIGEQAYFRIDVLFKGSCSTPVTANNLPITLKYSLNSPMNAVLPQNYTQNLTYNHTYTAPALVFSTPAPTYTATDNTATWDLTVAAPVGTTNNTWIAKNPTISGVTITSIQEITCGGGTLIGSPLVADNGLYKLASLTGSRCFRIKTAYTLCGKDSLALVGGWNCAGYPANSNEFDRICPPTTKTLYVVPLPTQIQQIITTEPVGAQPMCSAFIMTMQVANAQTGTLRNIKVTLAAPITGGTVIEPSTSQMEYPANSGTWVSIPDPTPIGGNLFEWNASASNATIGTSGLPPAVGTTNDHTFKIRFQVRTIACQVRSGDVYTFVTTASNQCERPIYATNQVTAPIGVAGAPTGTNRYLVRLYKAPVALCSANTSEVRVSIKNLGSKKSTINDYIDVILASGLSLTNIVGIKNAPTGAPTITAVAGGTKYTYRMPANVRVSDSIVFRANVVLPAALACTPTQPNLMEVATKVLFSAVCSQNATPCIIDKLTGDAMTTFQIIRPNLDIISMNAAAVLGASGETVTGTIQVRNTGTVPFAANQTVPVRIYHDADLNGQYSAGDYLLGTYTLTGVIAVNATKTMPFSFLAPAGKACPLVVIIESSPCACSTDAFAITNVPVTLDPAIQNMTICSGTTTTINVPNLAGYTYVWSATSPTNALNYLSATNIPNPTFNFTNTTAAPLVFTYDLYLNRGPACGVNIPVTVTVPTISGCLSALGNRVWYDDNRNGIQDGGELGVPNITVTLLDNSGTPTGATATTDVNGNYSFTGLTPGTYSVAFSNLPTNYIFSPQTQGSDPTLDSNPNAGGTTAQVTLAPGENNTSLDAGIYQQPGSVGDYVWLDTNADGIQNGSESGVLGVIVTLYDTNGNIVATTTTNGNGYYNFPTVTPGTYTIGFDNFPPNTVLSPANQGGSTALDSNADPITGRTAPFTVGAGQSITDIDAGLRPEPASLGDRVWYDTNGNGVQDGIEPGASGILVTLYDNLGAVVTTMTTDLNGNYLFDNLLPGIYTVGFGTPPTGYIFSPQTQGGDTDADSDVNTLTGNTANISLTAGQNRTDIDAGLNPLIGSVGDYVWNDINANGINDENSTDGINGVTVQLWAETAPGSGVYALSQTMLTADDASGNPGYYNFVIGTTGNYYIQFPLTSPSDFGITTQTATSQTDDNSDADPITGRSPIFSIDIAGMNLNKENPTIDAGYKCSAIAAITGAPTPCVSPNTVLTATLTAGGSPSTYLWDNTTTGATITVSPTASTTYRVTVTAANGCTATTSITVEPPPVVIGISATAKICIGNNTTLTGSSAGAIGYVWNTGDATAMITVAPTVTTLYTVTASYANGCTATATVDLEVLQVIVVNSVTKVEPTTCVPGNGSITINATGTVTTALEYNLFRLSTSSLISPTWQSSNVFNNLVADDYSVRVRYVGPKCAIIGSTVSLVAPTPPSPSTTAACNGVNTVLTATGGVAYAWNTGAATASITISAAAIYTVTVTDAGGCTASTTMAATLLPCAASLGDRVWLDDNQDGIQDLNEVGVSGVTVTLYNNVGVAIGVTKTDAYGKYLFTGLTPGSYTVGFSLTANYVFSPNGGGSDSGTGTDSDANTSTGRSNTITLTSGEQELNVDAGLYFALPLKQSIGDYVWYDDNADGVQDGSEKGLSGVTVTLYDAMGTTILATTLTDGSGKYLFDNLDVGSYVVGFGDVAGLGYTSTSGGTSTTNSDADGQTGRTGLITLSIGDNLRDIDAGFVANASTRGSIGDRVWNDTDGNGKQDANENGVSGVTVNLLDATGAVVATTQTDAYGKYLFDNLESGRYRVVFVPSTLPTGFSLVSKDALGTTDSNDSDADVTTGKTAWISLGVGEKNLTVDAGIYNSGAPTGGLGNYVWFDADQDGVQDANETGLGGVTVTLYASDGITVVRSTVTDATGYYAFHNLPSGNYVVGFTNVPAGYIFTTADGVGSTSANGSDANVSTGKTGVISVGVLFRDDIDAGLYPSGTPSGQGSIGNYVWYDTNNDGLQSGTEVGVSGVTVNLYNSSGVIISTQKTDATGHYLFTGLAKGDYSIGFANLPSGYSLVSQNNPTDDSRDSDADTGTGLTGRISLAAGEDNFTVDAGIYSPTAGVGAIGNFVWNDANGDGIQNDGGNSGVSGVSVILYGSDGVTIVSVTTTDANGYYLFPNLPLGDYSVGFGNLPDGFEFTNNTSGTSATGSDANPITGRTSVISLTVGSPTNVDTDAGIRSTTRAGLGDYVWLDSNGNGLQEVGEPPLAGVLVTLYLSDGTRISSSVTDAKGYYSFLNLDASLDYIVGFSNIPLGATFTQQETGSTSNGSNADPLTGRTGIIDLTPGEFNSTIDAGITLQKSGLGNYVWNDGNSNGLQDNDESGVAGVVVILYDELNGGVVIGKTVTDGNGYYSFTNLNPGTYSVEFVQSSLPLGAIFTTYTSGTANGSDADPMNGTTANITLVAGEYNPNIDAGIVTKASLGDYVWIDSNQDGLQDDTESPLGGVVVNLYRTSNLVTPYATTTTNAKGFYWFDGLNAGDYVVEFGEVPTYSRTIPTGQIGGSPTGETLLYNSDADVASGRTAVITLGVGARNPNIDAGYYVSPLPVKLLYLKAIADGCAVQVAWATATEQNADTFEVWRSTDGVRYTKITTLKAFGNSNTPQYYTFEDSKPGRLNYYKLVETDYDGRSETFMLSGRVELKGCNDLTEGISALYPNPNNTDAVTLRFYTSESAQLTTLLIYDVVGRVVSRTQVATTTGINTIDLDITTLASGTYTIRVSGESWYSTAQKLVRIKE